ncbi:tetratricopeptide repeat protein [Streptomyces sp. NPDC048751]|uniref:tetratricopeptide repeat protein n=1 Tax=Streptomyces sp. NPDC048751 TaxID=3365591 RepID=UPI00371C2E57
MDRSLRVTEQSLGVQHEEYAGSLNIKGSMLERAKRYAEAGAAHEQALEIIREVFSRRSERSVEGTLVEILNDYAAFLLRKNPHGPADALPRAVALLDEANAHLERGEYGWRQVTMNRAHALHQSGRLDEAEGIFRDLVGFCEENHGPESYELSVALRDLADVLEDQGKDEEYEAVLLRAHEVDDAESGELL